MTADTPSKASSSGFDIIASYHEHLSSSVEMPMPIASIFALCDLITIVPSNTTSELISLLHNHSSLLKASLKDPVPPMAGLDLFFALVNKVQWDSRKDFEAQKKNLVALAREYAEHTVPSCREEIIQKILPFIQEGASILTHSYSRVVIQILIAAHKHNRNIKVFVTEARPNSLGHKTHAQLLEAGVPCQIICDSTAAYMGEKIDFVLVGAEGVCESGGILNAIGTLGLGLVAKNYGKPFYVVAESYKFLRLFPLSQSDLNASPTTPSLLLGRASPSQKVAEPTTREQKVPPETEIPAVDYTWPELITFIFSDVGALRPSGVGEALLAVYAGNTD